MLKGPHFYVYVDRIGEWRWHFRASNGEVIADSGEGYVRKADCLYAINLLKKEAGGSSTLGE